MFRNRLQIACVLGVTLTLSAVLYGFVSTSRADSKKHWLTFTVRSTRLPSDMGGGDFKFQGPYTAFLQRLSDREFRIGTQMMLDEGWEPFSTDTEMIGDGLITFTHYRREATEEEYARIKERFEKENAIFEATENNNERYKTGRERWGIVLDNVVPDGSVSSEARIFASKSSLFLPLEVVMAVDPSGGTEFKPVSNWDDLKRLVTGLEGKIVAVRVRSFRSGEERTERVKISKP